MGNDKKMRYLIWLQQVFGYASVTAVKVLEHFKTAENVYNADIRELKESGLLSKSQLDKIAKTDILVADKILRDCKELSVKTVGLGSKDYPYSLSVIENPPLVLYYKGELPDFLNTPTICIVGPRKVSEFGKKAAYSLSFRLAKAGFNIVSGGAVGTDTYAHAGALKAGGITALCMGCGIEYNYCPENKPLRESVAKSGCLISEYPPKVSASRFSFPVRNRILAALSHGTVVIEAGIKSGALITANHANEQGRDVFVIPGGMHDKCYEGSNALMRDGAKPILDISDIFNEYSARFPDKINIEKAYNCKIIEKDESYDALYTKKNEKSLKNSNITLSKEAEIVYNNLDKQKFFPDEILNTGLAPAQILSALTELEMEFLIKALPGGMYEKTNS